MGYILLKTSLIVVVDAIAITVTYFLSKTKNKLYKWIPGFVMLVLTLFFLFNIDYSVTTKEKDGETYFEYNNKLSFDLYDLSRDALLASIGTIILIKWKKK